MNCEWIFIKSEGILFEGGWYCSIECANKTKGIIERIADIDINLEHKSSMVERNISLNDSDIHFNEEEINRMTDELLDF